MKAPKEFNNNLKKGILTKEMLEACLLSVNKRAKNWRDREREYRQYREDYYDNCEKAREKKEYYYWKKEILLSILKPTCIHRELLGFDKIRYYADEPGYEEHLDEYTYTGWWCDRERGCEIPYGEVEDKNRPNYNYYFYYDFGGKHTFHTPINYEEIEKYNLKTVDISHLNTYGMDIKDLISPVFVRKVTCMIQTGEYKVDEELAPYVKM